MEFRLGVFLQELLVQPVPHRAHPLAGFHSRLQDRLDNLLHTLIGFVGVDGVDDGFGIGGVGHHGDGVVVRALLVMKFQVEGLGDLVVGSHERGDGLGLEGHGRLTDTSK